MSFRIQMDLYLYFHHHLEQAKQQLVKKISKIKNFITSVSHTTRKPRSNEILMVKIIFVT